MSLLFPERRWILVTALTPEGCAGRLQSKLRGMWQTSPIPGKPLYGTVTRAGFAVQFYPGYPGQQYFNPYFIRGVFKASAGQTSIRATYGPGNTFWHFVAVFVSTFLFLVWGPALFNSHYSPQPELQAVFGYTVVAILLVLYWGIREARLLPELEGDPIVETLVEILEAEITEVGGEVG